MANEFDRPFQIHQYVGTGLIVDGNSAICDEFALVVIWENVGAVHDGRNWRIGFLEGDKFILSRSL